MAEGMKSAKALEFKTGGIVFPSPVDWRDIFIYFLLVDRFDDNDRSIPGFEDSSAPRERDPEEGKVFQGGTLKGVIRRLDYIRGLGVNAIWLSPVFKNRWKKDDAYHGYGIQDFLEIDPRFGTREDLQVLVKGGPQAGNVCRPRYCNQPYR